jgi:hypothetical protein
VTAGFGAAVTVCVTFGAGLAGALWVTGLAWLAGAGFGGLTALLIMLMATRPPKVPPVQVRILRFRDQLL